MKICRYTSTISSLNVFIHNYFIKFFTGFIAEMIKRYKFNKLLKILTNSSKTSRKVLTKYYEKINV